MQPATICVQPLPTHDAIQHASDNEPEQLNLHPLTQQNHRRRDVHRLLTRNRQAHTISDLDRDQAFSWTRCLISLVSYALLLSDVLRTGLGIRTPPRALIPVEPDTMIFIGPTAYLVNHLTMVNATDNGRGDRFWPYKYDTTSIGMRALAEYFGLSTWSRCVLYREHCDESRGLSRASTFAMIDSLIESVATHVGVEASQRQGGVRRNTSVGHITVRTESELRDRLYHFALPWFFQQTIKRTNQAIHRVYSANLTASSSLCGSVRSPRPFSCLENWTRSFPGTCSATRSVCHGEPRVWEYIPTRLAMLADLYPGHTIDFAVLDGMEDYTRAAMTVQGRKYHDIVLLSRVRQCHDGRCTTVAVDDYRYEASGFIMNARDWFAVVATLRVVGQVYTWLRVVLLIVICHAVRRGRCEIYRRASALSQVRTIVRSIFLIPSQVVIYGSMLPISLYMLAHLIDSPAIYEMVSIRYNSLLGDFSWNASDFVSHCAVSMRTVWVMSFLCHLALGMYTKCVWSPTSGIPGVPELFISFVASLTIFAQYRSVAMRSTKVLQVEEIVPSLRMHLIRSQGQRAPRPMLVQLLLGSSIDYQCIQTAVLGLMCVSLTLRVVQRWLPGLYQLTIVSRSFGPYSAGALWPRNRLVVSWPEFNFSTTSALGASTTSQRRAGTLASVSVHPRHLGQKEIPRLPLRMNQYGFVRSDYQASKTMSLRIRSEMQSIGSRTRQFESAVYLMNVAVMTDPLTMLQLRFFNGSQVGLYESKATQQCFLVPCELRTSSADITIDWDELHLIAIVNTKDLEWDDLLRCG